MKLKPFTRCFPPSLLRFVSRSFCTTSSFTENSTKKVRTVRGTHDYFGEEQRVRTEVVDIARNSAQLYGYAEVSILISLLLHVSYYCQMSTPIFEYTDLFQRTLGSDSDVVTKEMYTFCDRSNNSLTLRPENTAGYPLFDSSSNFFDYDLSDRRGTSLHC